MSGVAGHRAPAGGGTEEPSSRIGMVGGLVLITTLPLLTDSSATDS